MLIPMQKALLRCLLDIHLRIIDVELEFLLCVLTKLVRVDADCAAEEEPRCKVRIKLLNDLSLLVFMVVP